MNIPEVALVYTNETTLLGNDMYFQWVSLIRGISNHPILLLKLEEVADDIVLENADSDTLIDNHSMPEQHTPCNPTTTTYHFSYSTSPWTSPFHYQFPRCPG